MREGISAYRITDIDESERPRERLANLGAQSLKTAELIAILLRVGVQGENAVQLGERLLITLGGLIGLHRISYEELCKQHGLGPAKAAQIKAALELGSRLPKEIRAELPAIHNPEDAANLVMYEMSSLEQEELRVVLLDSKNRVIKIETAYLGSVNQSQIRVGELFKFAVRYNAVSMIVVHNHPSGDPTPSPDDVSVTRAIVQAGSLLNIEVIDHIIIGLNKFVSLKDRGLGF
jgi:DNA repair protein RadC